MRETDSDTSFSNSINILISKITFVAQKLIFDHLK